MKYDKSEMIREVERYEEGGKKKFQMLLRVVYIWHQKP